MSRFRNFWRVALIRILRFIPIYLREMTQSNIRVAIDALRPQPHFSPGFVEISLAGYNPIQRWEALCLITMTPGTLAVEKADGSDSVLVHALYMTNEDEVRNDIETLLRQALGAPQPQP